MNLIECQRRHKETDTAELDIELAPAEIQVVLASQPADIG
jgi:hypothetical protein